MKVGSAVVPIVVGSCIFDLSCVDGSVRPDAAMGRSACMAAGKGMAQGKAGAGMGATVGKLIPGAVAQDSGIGSASCGVELDEKLRLKEKKFSFAFSLMPVRTGDVDCFEELERL